MNELILFNKFVIRIGQLCLTVALLVTMNVIDISLLHVDHVLSDRLKYLALLIVALNRPVMYSRENSK